LIEYDEFGAMVRRFDLVTVAKRVARGRKFETAKCERIGTVWSAASPDWLAPGDYRIVNYEPQFLLMRSEGSDDAVDRTRFWATIENYHEHRPLESQESSASDVSRWLAEEVIAPLRPLRVLELGCGAGRNLAHITRAMPSVEVVGVEINPSAAARATTATGVTIHNRSLYEPLDDLGTFDIVFTAGVLMHIPHESAEGVVRAMVNRASKAVIHFELHGDSHTIDFHHYPRDYRALFSRLGLASEYRVLGRKDPLNAGESVGQMALLTCRTEARA